MKKLKLFEIRTVGKKIKTFKRSKQQQKLQKSVEFLHNHNGYRAENIPIVYFE